MQKPVVPKNFMTAVVSFLIILIAFASCAKAFSDEYVSQDEDVIIDQTVRVSSAGLTGKVFETDGETPLHNALVSLQQGDTDHIVVYTYTDEEGRYDFNDIPEGRFNVLVDGAVLATIDVVSDAPVTQVNFSIAKSAASATAGE